MRSFLVLIGLILIIPGFYAQEAVKQDTPSKDSTYQERQEKQFDFYPGGKIEIANGVPGNLKIIGWQKASIRLEAEKIVYNLQAEPAKKLLEQFPIHVSWNQTAATIRTSGPLEPPGAMKIELTLYVPEAKTDIKALIKQGDLEIAGVNGWVETTSEEGNIVAKSMSGYFSATTQRGDILIEMSGIRWRGMELAAVTQDGSVELILPADYSAALQLETRDGNMTIQYPPLVVDGETIPLQVMTQGSTQSLAASVGEGGAPIKLFTRSGDMRLSMKQD